MKGTTFRIKVWFTFAIATASLVLASSASAKMYAGDAGGSAVTLLVPVASTPSGFNWTDATVGAAVALATVLAALAVAYLARNRNRLAASH